jgi:S1-C subfamily serine protease
VRSRRLVSLVIVAALLGGLASLGVARLIGWAGPKKTVVVKAGPVETVAALPAAVRSSAKPLPGNDFEPARIYRERSPGVVTIFAYFGNPDSPDAQAAQGSGFVVSREGYILTNSHVVTNAGESNPVRAANALYVEFSDLDRVPARIVGWDVYDDVGLIKVDPGPHALSPVPLGTSSNVLVGEPVAAIGSPLGNENSLAVGIVSAVHRAISALTAQQYNLVDAIQTDAPITHGNSGGPLFDARGRVIGINAQIRSSSGSGNDVGIGFAVPIDSAKRSLDQLLRQGHVDYAFVGIRTASLTPSIARKLGYKVRRPRREGGAARRRGHAGARPAVPARRRRHRRHQRASRSQCGRSCADCVERPPSRPGGDLHRPPRRPPPEDVRRHAWETGGQARRRLTLGRLAPRA